MKQLTIQEQYEYYVYTLSHIGTFLLSCNVDEVGYRVFEEFDGDSVSFLHDSVLTALLDAGLIGKEESDLSRRLRDGFRAMENTPLWNTGAVLADPQWRELLQTADRVKGMMQRRGNDAG